MGQLTLMWLMLAVGLAVGLTVAQYAPGEEDIVTETDDQPAAEKPSRGAGLAKVVLVVGLVWWLRRRGRQ